MKRKRTSFLHDKGLRAGKNSKSKNTEEGKSFCTHILNLKQ
jgi:hypothetical protein